MKVTKGLKNVNSYLPYIELIIGFALLVKGADVLVDGASSIARKLNISDLVIGLTMVSFGTSAPELFVNLVATIKGNTGIAVGNIVGSNIANVFLIVGVSSVIYPLAIKKETLWRGIPFSIFASFLFLFLANDFFLNGKSQLFLGRGDGLIFCIFFLLFMTYVFKISKNDKSAASAVGEKEFSTVKSLLMVLGGIFLLSFSGKWIVDGAVEIALRFGLSETLIGLTIIAVGTSLPELAASAVAAFKKKPELSVGNVVGSNIFNIFFVLGICSAVNPIPFKSENNFDVGVMIFSTIALFIFMFTGGKSRIDRWEGAVFVVSYITYIVYLIEKSGIIAL